MNGWTSTHHHRRHASDIMFTATTTTHIIASLSTGMYGREPIVRLSECADKEKNRASLHIEIHLQFCYIHPPLLLLLLVLVLLCWVSALSVVLEYSIAGQRSVAAAGRGGLSGYNKCI